MHEKQIEIRWRDQDAYGHVNNAVYLTYLEEVRDEWLERALGDSGDAWGYVTARVAIDFRRELTQDDDAIVARLWLTRIGTSSVTTREQIVTVGGELAAEAEAVLVARDTETGRSRPLSDAERAALERELGGV
ncbi:MAG TPA: thioesterase family protein [Gaiellaceae bacterium]|nr:thioesterase family protein [Gaiellaceae bacterium]